MQSCREQRDPILKKQNAFTLTNPKKNQTLENDPYFKRIRFTRTARRMLVPVVTLPKSSAVYVFDSALYFMSEKVDFAVNSDFASVFRLSSEFDIVSLYFEALAFVLRLNFGWGNEYSRFDKGLWFQS